MTTDAVNAASAPSPTLVAPVDAPSMVAARNRAADQSQTSPRTHSLPSHIPALDGIRGIAVLLVLLCHATQRPFGDQANEIFTSSIDKLILSVARFSWSGVDLFFVLSGFLITGILFDAKGKDHFFRNFYARRTVRIFPLYYTCLVLYLVLVPLLPAAVTRGFGDITTSRIWYPLYLSNYSQSIAEQAGHVVDHVIHVSWSLSIEEQFYLCWPLVVFLFTRKTLLKICVGMFFGSMLLRTGLLAYDKWLWAMGFTPCRVDGLAVGAAIALIARGPMGLRSLVKPALWIGPISTVLLAGMIIAMQKMGYRRGMGQSPGYVVCGTSLLAMMYGSLLVLAAAAAKGTRANWFFAHPVLRCYGKYSYAVYLLHLPIVIWTANYLFMPSRFTFHNTMLPGLLAFYAITFTASLVAAVISWNVLEKHCLKLKDFFPMEVKEGSGAVSRGTASAAAAPAKAVA
jgi:peptidoglycan/LPS O-acetylase OafA/YrhL